MTLSQSRRELLRSVAFAWPVLPTLFSDDPYRSPLIRRARPGAAVRIRGRVHAAGRGLGRVAVSDGRSVVATDRTGRYELITTGERRFVSVSVPAGHELPVSETATARAFAPIDPGRSEQQHDFGLVPLEGGDDRHAFLLLSDVQTENPTDMRRFHAESVPDVAATIGALGGLPLFGVANGDIMWDDLSLYDEYERATRRLGIPFVQVVGNHDLDLDARTDEASTATFQGRFGPRYWSFNRGQVHYVVLDDVLYYGGGYIGYLDDEQLAWLTADLALVERGTPVVVFAHIPITSTLWKRRGEPRPAVAQALTNREALFRALEGHRALLLTGHIHESDHLAESGTVERCHGTVCGGWWTGDICYDGTPNGYGVYEVEGSEIRWRYKSTGLPDAHQLRVYPRGADPRAPEEIVANVWAWDPGWSVVWYQGGDRRGLMSRRVGFDPLAMEKMAGPDLPAIRGWVDPIPTGHLFYAPVAPGAGDIRVEATDPSGRRYTASP